MQNAKDSFYIALRNRLVVLNPARSIKVRGVQRPSLLVEDAEAPAGEVANDVFVLRWTAVTVVADVSCALNQLVCEVRYGTSGTQDKLGLDRGRALSEMDGELLSVLQPVSTPKMLYATTPPSAMLTCIFWTEPELGPVVVKRDVLERVVKVTVFAFQEPGEL